jgi:hypothetical protein
MQRIVNRFKCAMKRTNSLSLMSFFLNNFKIRLALNNKTSELAYTGQKG